MDPVKQKVSCPRCGSAWDSLESLVKHTTRTHQVSSRALWGILNGEEPKCPCGCGETPKFLNVVQGFREFSRGVDNRMKNGELLYRLWGGDKGDYMIGLKICDYQTLIVWDEDKLFDWTGSRIRYHPDVFVVLAWAEEWQC